MFMQRKSFVPGLTILLSILSPVILWSATGSVEWGHLFSGDSSLIAYDVTTSNGHSTIMCGSETESNGNQNGWLAKLDKSGTLIWQKSFDNGGWDVLYSVKPTPDGGYIACGATTVPGDSVCDAWLVKCDSSGNRLWDAPVNVDTTANLPDFAHCVFVTHDNSIVMCGETIISATPYQTHAWMIKTNSNGTVSFTRNFAFDLNQQKAQSILETSDGGFLTVGTFTDSIQLEEGWIAKTDSEGDSVWLRIAGGSGDDEFLTLCATQDGDYIAGGRTASAGSGKFDGWLLRFTQNGTVLWEKSYGGPENDVIQKILQASFGAFLGVGYTTSPIDWDQNAWAIKVNDDGHLKWQISYDHESTESLTGIVENNDADFYACGYADSSNIIKALLLKIKDPDKFLPPKLMDPAADKIGLGSKLWFHWETLPGTIYYSLDVDDDTDFGSPVFHADSLTISRCLADGLSAATTYYWRVTACAGVDSCAISKTLKFTTMIPPPINIEQPEEYVLSYLRQGDECYIDDDKTLGTFSAELNNLLWIRTAQTDRITFADTLIYFELLKSATVYIACEDLSGQEPVWLKNDYVRTNYQIFLSGNENPFLVYAKEIAAGKYALKSIEMDSTHNNYLVLVDFNSSGFASVPVLFEKVYNSSPSFGDYDNDHDLDVLITGMNDSFIPVTKLYRNKNNGETFEPVNTSLPGLYSGTAVWGDYNNDNFIDLLMTGLGNNGPMTHLYYNDQTGQLIDSQVPLTPLSLSDAAWGDYDNDGDLDLLICGRIEYGSIVTKIFCNNGDGTFSDTFTALQGVEEGAVDWGDYDADGHLDFIVTGKDAQLFKGYSIIYHNDGNGNFVDIHAGLPGVFYSSVAWGDYDNDGLLDLALMGLGSSGNVTKIFHNNGNNNFVNSGFVLKQVNFGSVAWGDCDNDGDLDLLLTGNHSTLGAVTRIYRNDGQGGFTEFDPHLEQVNNSNAVWGDYDNDNDLDILMTGYSGVKGNITKLYNNNPYHANKVPIPPQQLKSEVLVGGMVQLSWSAAQDLETPQRGLSYNLRIGLASGGSDGFTPMALADGYRQIVKKGIIQGDTSFTIHNLADGIYYWSVQTLDHNMAGSNFSAQTAFSIGAVPIVLSSFNAAFDGNAIKIEWCTASENSNLGFYLLRAEESDMQYIIVNKELITGNGTCSIQHNYNFLDRDVHQGSHYYYKLEQIDLNGSRKTYGPVYVTQNAAVPDRFCLYQNYPNPFNSATHIRFDIAQPTECKIDIFNIRGEIVKRLLDHQIAAGQHDLIWDGTGMNGVLVPSGIYYYKIQTRSFHDLKKLILIK
jgi:hypothetical protein